MKFWLSLFELATQQNPYPSQISRLIRRYFLKIIKYCLRYAIKRHQKLMFWSTTVTDNIMNKFKKPKCSVYHSGACLNFVALPLILPSLSKSLKFFHDFASKCPLNVLTELNFLFLTFYSWRELEWQLFYSFFLF